MKKVFLAIVLALSVIDNQCMFANLWNKLYNITGYKFKKEQYNQSLTQKNNLPTVPIHEEQKKENSEKKLFGFTIQPAHKHVSQDAPTKNGNTPPEKENPNITFPLLNNSQNIIKKTEDNVIKSQFALLCKDFCTNPYKKEEKEQILANICIGPSKVHGNRTRYLKMYDSGMFQLWNFLQSEKSPKKSAQFSAYVVYKHLLRLQEYMIQKENEKKLETVTIDYNNQPIPLKPLLVQLFTSLCKQFKHNYENKPLCFNNTIVLEYFALKSSFIADLTDGHISAYAFSFKQPEEYKNGVTNYLIDFFIKESSLNLENLEWLKVYAYHVKHEECIALPIFNKSGVVGMYTFMHALVQLKAQTENQKIHVVGCGTNPTSTVHAGIFSTRFGLIDHDYQHGYFSLKNLPIIPEDKWTNPQFAKQAILLYTFFDTNIIPDLKKKMSKDITSESRDHFMCAFIFLHEYPYRCVSFNDYFRIQLKDILKEGLGKHNIEDFQGKFKRDAFEAINTFSLLYFYHKDLASDIKKLGFEIQKGNFIFLKEQYSDEEKTIQSFKEHIINKMENLFLKFDNTYNIGDFITTKASD